MTDRAFFQQTIEILRERHIYDRTIWGYSLFHKDDPELIKETLMLCQD